MKRILFVDDEENILQGLRRMLRSMRNEWDTEFANSGKEALSLLEKSSFDVVVSDIRMPVMDGAQFLREVKKLYPQIVRIILSGQSDQEALLKSIEVAHQFLTKPFDAKSLKAVMTRVFTLRELMEEQSLKQLVSSIDSLPTLPGVYMEIQNELNSPEVSLARVGEIISKDVGMTTKILQMINSAYFGLRSRITSTQHAVVLLGLDTIKSLMLITHMFSRFKEVQLKGFNIDTVIAHSMKTGTFASLIAKTEGKNTDIIDEARLAGFLHDCGKLLLADKLKAKYAEVVELASKHNAPLWQIEYDMLGTSHAEVGAYLLGLWGLPDSIIEILAFHHHPDDCLHEGFSSLAAVEAANLFAHEMEPHECDSLTVEIADYYLKSIGLQERLPVWQNLCNEVSARLV
ncbi:MAG: HDOD domain-containing protein [bacterium]